MERVKRERKDSLWRDVWFRLTKNKAALISLIFLAVLIVLTLSADLLFDYDTQVINQYPEQRLQAPSSRHWFGTDAFGRDQFARTVFGARYSLSIGFIGTLIAVVASGLLGATVALYGGMVDNIVMRLLDIIMCIPGMLLMLAIVAVLGGGLVNMMVAIVISSIPGFTRIVRSVVMGIIGQEYIEAARAAGARSGRIVVFHILPNAFSVITVEATMQMAGIIMTAAGLSFIGMGVKPPAPEWGAMLSEATKYMRQFPHLILYPGLAIGLTALSFNLLGDGLAEAIDPRLKD